MKFKLTAFLFLLALISCKTDPSDSIEEGKITENIYYSKQIGWEMEIPKGWDIIDKNVSDERTEKGLDILSETSGFEYDINALTHLLNFQKNDLNIFQSTSEPFELEYEGEWEENNAFLKQLIYDTFIQRGIKVDSTATKIVTIDGVKFHSYKLTLYNKDGDAILNQIIYSSLINGFDFGVNINYNNESDKKEMLDVWYKSKFKAN